MRKEGSKEGKEGGRERGMEGRYILYVKEVAEAGMIGWPKDSEKIDGTKL